MDTAGNTTSLGPPAIKTANPRLKRRPRAAGRRHIAKRALAPPAAAVVASKAPIISGIPPFDAASSSQLPEDASVAALSIPEKGPNMSNFCHAYIPAKRPKTAQQEEEPARRAPAERRQQQPENNTMMSGPVVTIVDGEIVLQQPRRQETPRALDEMTTVVEDEVDTAIISASYNSFKTGQKAENNRGGWNFKETQLFYEALCAVGLDFGLMVTYFDKAIEDAADDNDTEKIRRRTRRQLKNKHRIETAKRPELVQKAIWGGRRGGRRENIELLIDEVTDEVPDKGEEEGEKEVQSNNDKPEEASQPASQVEDTDDGPQTEQTEQIASSAPVAAADERSAQEDNNYGEGEDPFDDEENYIDDYDI